MDIDTNDANDANQKDEDNDNKMTEATETTTPGTEQETIGADKDDCKSMYIFEQY